MTTDDRVLPEGMQALLEIFATELADVRFGDLDRTSLERSAASVRVAVEQLANAEAAAEAARDALESLQSDLLQTGQRALAYARIYAEATPALEEKVHAITLSGRARRLDPQAAITVEGAPRRRGRPPKVVSEVTGTLALEPADESRAGATPS